MSARSAHVSRLADRLADRSSLPPRSEFSSSELKSVGNYTLGRLVGKGSFGMVYLATHKLTNGSKVRCSISSLSFFPSPGLADVSGDANNGTM